jgi:hypothetical protein
VGTTILPSALKKVAEYSSEMLVPTYRFTQSHNPADHSGRLHRRENLTPRYASQVTVCISVKDFFSVHLRRCVYIIYIYIYKFKTQFV